MKNKIIIVLISGVLLTANSCNKATKSVMSPTTPIPVEITPIILPDSFPDTTSESASDIIDNYSNWKIQKKSLGPISIGMDVKEVNTLLSSFKKQNAYAEDFGFSGGSPAYIYSDNNEQILAIVQTLNNKKVFAIIAISDQLKTEDGIHPKMSVAEFLNFYPTMRFFLDPMNGWEYAEELTKDWDFIFTTNSKNRIGVYTQPEKSTLPKRTTAINTWITIR
ncbi:MAG TPA: hypothetical protein VLZ75_09820 [Chitinophagales bacterium]|nr:hypothetical protein [Chitinophagales bacterium]